MVPARCVAQFHMRADFPLRPGHKVHIAQCAVMDLFNRVQRAENRELILVELQAPIPAPNNVRYFQRCSGVWRFEFVHKRRAEAGGLSHRLPTRSFRSG
jgi:hypothetical protein